MELGVKGQTFLVKHVAIENGRLGRWGVVGDDVIYYIWGKLMIAVYHSENNILLLHAFLLAQSMCHQKAKRREEEWHLERGERSHLRSPIIKAASS